MLERPECCLIPRFLKFQFVSTPGAEDTPTGDSKMNAGRALQPLRKHSRKLRSVLPCAVHRETVDHVMQVVLSHEWPVTRAIPSALESVALSLSRVRTSDNGALERFADYLTDKIPPSPQQACVPAKVYSLLIRKLAQEAAPSHRAKPLVLKMVQSSSSGGGGGSCTLSHSTERALIGLFKEDPEELVNVIMAMRAQSVTPTLWMYNRVLDEVLIAGRTTKQENATYSQLAQYISKAIAMDWGKGNRDTMVVLLQNARDLSHLVTLWTELQKTSMKFDKRMSEEVVRLFLTLGELTSNRWGVPVATKTSIHRVSEVLIRDFLPRNEPISMAAFTEVMKACRRMGQVAIAADVFHAFTSHTRRLPGEEMYKELMRTLTQKPVDAEMLHKIWDTTKALCHGEPPLWAYVAYTMPIGRHVGRSKLEEMLKDIFIRRSLLNETLSLYHYKWLIRACCAARPRAKKAALQLLDRAVEDGLVPDEGIFSALLTMHKSPKDYGWYMEAILAKAPVFRITDRALKRGLWAAMGRVVHQQMKTGGRQTPIADRYSSLTGNRYKSSDLLYTLRKCTERTFRDIQLTHDEYFYYTLTNLCDAVSTV